MRARARTFPKQARTAALAKAAAILSLEDQARDALEDAASAFLLDKDFRRAAEQAQKFVSLVTALAENQTRHA